MKFFTSAVIALYAGAFVNALPAISNDGGPQSLEERATACTAAATDKLIFSVSISSFTKSRNAKKPSCFNWTSDDCSKSPDRPAGFNFKPSCRRHDFGYRNTKKQKRFTSAMKARIDSNLKKDLYNECKQYHGLMSWKGVECRRIADIYYLAVKKLGKRKLEAPTEEEFEMENPEVEDSVEDSVAELESVDSDTE